MKQLKRSPEKFDLLDLYEAMGKNSQLKLSDKDSHVSFLEEVATSLSENMSDTLIFGKRVESMFLYIAASLDQCTIIKQEDSGQVFHSCENIRLPDYRIILKDKKEILVEVKNFHHKRPFSDYSISVDYYMGIKEYSLIMNTELKFAIYWSRWNIWTLTSIEEFERNENKYTISFKKAIMKNHMNILGDYLIGTTPPLHIRAILDKENRITEVKYYCNGKLIQDDKDRNIALILIQFGEWNVNEPKVIENKVKYLEIEAIPKEDDNNQNFSMIGNLSSIISNQYKLLTAPNGEIERLTPNIEPSNIGLYIPVDHKSSELPLWRFHISSSDQ